jgi:hypothetical protein
MSGKFICTHGKLVGNIRKLVCTSGKLICMRGSAVNATKMQILFRWKADSDYVMAPVPRNDSASQYLSNLIKKILSLQTVNRSV